MTNDYTTRKQLNNHYTLYIAGADDICGGGSGQVHSLFQGNFSTECNIELLPIPSSGDRIPVEARFSAPVQIGPGAHPASCTMGTGSFPGVKSGRGVTLTPHPLLVSWS